MHVSSKSVPGRRNYTRTVPKPVAGESPRCGDDELRALLDAGEVLWHPFIIGELACGSMAKQTEILDLLKALPQSTIAEHNEVMHFLEFAIRSRTGLD